MKKVLIAGFALAGAVLAATSAQAACSQQFVNTTCDWLGRNCKNHFKSVCTPDKVTIAPAAKTGVSNNAALANNAANVKPGAGLVGNAGGALIGNAGGALIGNAGGALVSQSGSTMRH